MLNLQIQYAINFLIFQIKKYTDTPYSSVTSGFGVNKQHENAEEINQDLNIDNEALRGGSFVLGKHCVFSNGKKQARIFKQHNERWDIENKENIQENERKPATDRENNQRKFDIKAINSAREGICKEVAEAPSNLEKDSDQFNSPEVFQLRNYSQQLSPIRRIAWANNQFTNIELPIEQKE